MDMECSVSNMARGRSAERRSTPRRRAQSVDSAAGKASQDQLVWEAMRWREAFFEARAQAEALQEELVQLQEAVLSSQNEEGRGAAASRYVARLAKENLKL